MELGMWRVQNSRFRPTKGFLIGYWCRLVNLFYANKIKFVLQIEISVLYCFQHCIICNLTVRNCYNLSCICIGYLSNLLHLCQSEAVIFHKQMIGYHYTTIYMEKVLNVHFLDLFYWKMVWLQNVFIRFLCTDVFHR